MSINGKNTPLITNTRNVQDTNPEINAVLTRKVIIPPGQTVSAQINILQVPTCDEFLFNPKIISDNIQCHPSIYSNNHNPLLGQDKDSSHQQNKFFILIENKSEHEAVHLNKGQNIGYITTDCCVDENLPSSSSHQINLIQACEEVLAKRKEQLKQTDFKLSHLSTEQQEKLLEVLMSHYAAFSKSLETLGCTDKVVPKLNFVHKNPIHTLPFPIPQTLQEHALKQLEELQPTALIERTVTEWACPMVLVKKKK